MVQAQNSTNTSQNFQKKNMKATFKQRNSPSQKPSHTQGTSTRKDKRRRWAKKHKPVAKPVVKQGPVKEYVSDCCSVLARKPKAFQKEVAKDPESGKMKETTKGLGKWRCTTCGKRCKVTPRKPEVKEVVVDMNKVEQRVIASIPLAPTGVVARVLSVMPYAPYEGYSEVKNETSVASLSSLDNVT